MVRENGCGHKKPNPLPDHTADSTPGNRRNPHPPRAWKALSHRATPPCRAPGVPTEAEPAPNPPSPGKLCTHFQPSQTNPNALKCPRHDMHRCDATCKRPRAIQTLPVGVAGVVGVVCGVVGAAHPSGFTRMDVGWQKASSHSKVGVSCRRPPTLFVARITIRRGSRRPERLVSLNQFTFTSVKLIKAP